MQTIFLDISKNMRIVLNKRQYLGGTILKETQTGFLFSLYLLALTLFQANLAHASLVTITSQKILLS